MSPSPGEYSAPDRVIGAVNLLLLFLSELPVVLADFGGTSLWQFLPLSLPVFSKPAGSLVLCSGFIWLEEPLQKRKPTTKITFGPKDGTL